ncbi:MAG: hypothetical protein D6820_02280 [Lentisphaerae bacterium]|nr:MAG: hypothetical protein D6820_02280 [Lentisphaerota bacterium]
MLAWSLILTGMLIYSLFLFLVCLEAWRVSLRIVLLNLLCPFYVLYYVWSESQVPAFYRYFLELSVLLIFGGLLLI